jgi:hypothetical protein
MASSEDLATCKHFECETPEKKHVSADVVALLVPTLNGLHRIRSCRRCIEKTTVGSRTNCYICDAIVDRELFIDDEGYPICLLCIQEYAEEDDFADVRETMLSDLNTLEVCFICHNSIDGCTPETIMDLSLNKCFSKDMPGHLRVYIRELRRNFESANRMTIESAQKHPKTSMIFNALHQLTFVDVEQFVASLSKKQLEDLNDFNPFFGAVFLQNLSEIGRNKNSFSE